MDMHKDSNGGKKLELPKAHIPRWGGTGETTFSFQFSECMQVSFSQSCIFCIFGGDFLVILLFEMISKCSAEMLFSVPKGKKAVIWFMQKIDKLPSGMSYSTAGHTQS